MGTLGWRSLEMALGPFAKVHLGQGTTRTVQYPMEQPDAGRAASEGTCREPRP